MVMRTVFTKIASECPSLPTVLIGKLRTLRMQRDKAKVV